MVTTDMKACYMIVIDLCNHFKSRNVSFNDFRKSKSKVKGAGGLHVADHGN